MAQFHHQGSSQQQQQQQGYLGGPFVPNYNAPAYGMRGMPAAVAMPYVPYGLPPPAPVPAYHAAGLPPADGWQGGEHEAVAHLAQGIESNLMLNPQQQQMMGGPGQGQYYGNPQQRGPPPGAYGYAYAPPAPGLRGQQQPMMQHMGPQGMGGNPHQMLNGSGPYGHAAGGGPGHHQQGGMGPREGRSRGGGRGGHMQDHRQQPQQQQQQRRKKVQRGLEDNVKRTVYISYIDQQVTEESLATFFADCGTVMDCRICGDPNSAMRFAFIEFLEEAGAQEALNKTGCTLGTSQLRVLPSKTAIVPVNKELMPRSHEELERCSRTVYVANIDKKVEREDVRNFFEQLCGKVGKIRLLGDLAHSTRIAFIEFIQAEAAMAALNCSGALLGSLPLRVSPSKTPVRGEKDDKESRGGRQQQRPGSASRQGAAAAASSAPAAAPEDGEAAAAAAGAAGLGQENGGDAAAAAVAATEGGDSVQQQPATGAAEGEGAASSQAGDAGEQLAGGAAAAQGASEAAAASGADTAAATAEDTAAAGPAESEAPTAPEPAAAADAASEQQQEGCA